VVASQDGSRVFSTASDGSLHIVYTSALDFSTFFEPEAFAETVTSCQSGVTLVEIESAAVTGPATTTADAKVEYALYAVTDVTTGQDVSSRLLAVNIDGTLRWTLAVEGTVVGKPFVGADQNTFYIVHNIPSSTTAADAPGVGRISVIVVDPIDGLPLVTATLPETADNAPFGPATGKTIQQQQGPNNSSELDIVVFGENNDNGLSAQGALYMLIPSNENEALGGRGNAAYDLRLVFDFSRSTVARPAVSADGTAIYMGQQQSRLSGWNGRDDVSGVLNGSEEGVFPQYTVRPPQALQNGVLRKYQNLCMMPYSRGSL
jgi:hypothetical protein